MPKQVQWLGTLRPSQVLHSYGVGSVVELPHVAAIVLGLEDWTGNPITLIAESRLLNAVQHALPEDRIAELRQLPVPADAAGSDDADLAGIPIAIFPRWMVCPSCRLLAPLESGLFQQRSTPHRPDQFRYVHTSCSRGRPTEVLPVRFLTACSHGHLDEFPWHFFVHGGPSECREALHLTETGSLGDTGGIWVRCGCGARRPMTEAFGATGRKSLPGCRGRHPHLRDFDDTPCPEQLRTILLGASNSWFGLTLSALTVPDTSDRLRKLVDEYAPLLDRAKSAEGVQLLHDLGQLPRLRDYNGEAIWAVLEAKRTGEKEADAHGPTNLKVPEWQAFIDAEGANEKHFRLAAEQPPTDFATSIERVVLVERLREVRALVGFTRIASPGDLAEIAEIDPQQRARLTRNPARWVPAVEVHGEGIFLQFRESLVAEWLTNPKVVARDAAFVSAHRRWREAKQFPDPALGYPGMRYVLLHSFAHALMRQIALACGYSTASIRERIYALGAEAEHGPMAGILLYTAATDSEGTLGGLVSLGKRHELGVHITAALREIEVCASDPHCSEHVPGSDATLHGACCHACLFVPETSCERGNRYLDRSILIPTISETGMTFFV